jgi:hypothetical protein
MVQRKISKVDTGFKGFEAHHVAGNNSRCTHVIGWWKAHNCQPLLVYQ